MNFIQKIKLFSKASSAVDQIEEGIKMKTLTKVVGGVVAIATLLLQTQPVQTAVGGVLASHPNVGAVLGGIMAILALIHNPQSKQ